MQTMACLTQKNNSFKSVLMNANYSFYLVINFNYKPLVTATSLGYKFGFGMR